MTAAGSSKPRRISQLARLVDVRYTMGLGEVAGVSRSNRVVMYYSEH
jgi:hypothetical protein